MTTITVSEVRFARSRPEEEATGLLGYVSFLLNDSIRVNGVTLRDSKSGRMGLSFPARRSRHGRDYPIFFPINDKARLSIERQVLASILKLITKET